MKLLWTLFLLAISSQPDYRAPFIQQYGEVATQMLSVFDPNLPVLCPNPDPENWSVVAGTFTRTGRWSQAQGYPITLAIREGPMPATVVAHANGFWTFTATVNLEWQCWRIRAQNVLTPEQIAELKPGTGPAAVEVLLFIRGVPARPNEPPILYFEFGGGTS